jgi:SAM-dependent methyltransferase
MISELDTTGLLARAEYDHWWFQSRRAIMEHIFWKKLPFLSKDLKILCVGCGTGAELEQAAQFGQVTGVDIDPQVVALCKKKGLHVIQADILEASLPQESFDVVVAMDVIEHIQDDYKTVQALSGLLKKGGHLLVTVPALPCLWSSFDEEGDFPHFRRYTKKTLSDVLSSQPLKKEKLSYYNFFLFPVAFLARKTHSSFVAQMTVPSPWKNSLLRAVFSSEKYFLPLISFPVGVSLIALYQKQ